MNLDKLKELLEQQETFPHDFTLKFIGKNSPEFNEDVAKFEARRPTLRKQSERKSAADANLALTYLYLAASADEVVELLKEVATIRDVRVVL